MTTDGILVINKPQNWTSHDCVAVCRRVLGIKRVGHGGTLDPMAEGVLPVFIGRATRIMQYMDLDFKAYRCTVRLGITTDTRDIWGETILKRSTEAIDEAAIMDALDSFKGEISQVPPKYSALKVNGKKLYEYAREGIEVEIKPRKVFIKSLIVEKVDLEKMEVTFTVECSKGTYIRSICHDLGEMLGCGGAMSFLERISSGAFGLENSLRPDEMKTMELSEIEKYILPVDFPLIHFGKAELPKDRAVYFASGNSIRWHQVLRDVDDKPTAGAMYKVYQKETGRFLGVGFYDEDSNELKADKIFVTRQEL